MKKIIYIVLLLSVIIFSGCREDELFKAAQGDIVVEAGFSASTRTTFVEDDGVTHVSWNKDDAIGLITGNQTNLEYRALSEGSSCEFVNSGEKIKVEEGETVYAYYPYEYSTLSEDKVILPNTSLQEYEENVSEHDFLYASTQVTNGKVSLQFKHLFAFLRITIPLAQISNEVGKAKLSISSNEYISFNGYFDLKKEAIGEGSYSDGITYIIPSREELGDKQTITCYIAILPQSENAMIKVNYYPDDSDGQVITLLLQKHAPKGGFKPGNVYSLYLDGAEEEMEKDALIALYNATNGKAWKNNTNWCSDKPISEWYGVKAKGEVYEIDLSANNLSGIIPDEIGNLKGLSQLRLWGTIFQEKFQFQ